MLLIIYNPLPNDSIAFKNHPPSLCWENSTMHHLYSYNSDKLKCTLRSSFWGWFPCLWWSQDFSPPFDLKEGVSPSLESPWKRTSSCKDLNDPKSHWNKWELRVLSILEDWVQTPEQIWFHLAESIGTAIYRPVSMVQFNRVLLDTCSNSFLFCFLL